MDRPNLTDLPTYLGAVGTYEVWVQGLCPVCLAEELWSPYEADTDVYGPRHCLVCEWQGEEAC